MASITVYQTDRAGHFVEASTADESPLEPGVYLVPAGCIRTAPPDTWPSDKWPRWNGASWDMVTMPAAAQPDDAIAKLRAYLAANPDVAAVLNQGGV